MKNASAELKDLSNEQIKEQANKILQQRAAQRERMKRRNKERREYNKELLALAEKKNLLPKAVAKGSSSVS
jgi:hypothetical protein